MSGYLPEVRGCAPHVSLLLRLVDEMPTYVHFLRLDWVGRDDTAGRLSGVEPSRRLAKRPHERLAEHGESTKGETAEVNERNTTDAEPDEESRVSRLAARARHPKTSGSTPRWAPAIFCQTT
jgi:hypothetical protein